MYSEMLHLFDQKYSKNPDPSEINTCSKHVLLSMKPCYLIFLLKLWFCLFILWTESLKATHLDIGC